MVGESSTAYSNRRNPTTWGGAPNGSDLSTISGVTRQGFTFQDTLGQMGLNDMVGRVQDAITGRFLSADPYIPDPTDPQSYNRYSYTRNNPLSSADSSGFTDTYTDNSGGGGSAAPVSPCVNCDITIQSTPLGCVFGPCEGAGDPASLYGWYNANQTHLTQGGYINPFCFVANGCTNSLLLGKGTAAAQPPQSDPYPQLHPVTLSATSLIYEQSLEDELDGVN